MLFVLSVTALLLLLLLAILLWLKDVLDVDSIQTLERIFTDLRNKKHSHWLCSLFQVDEKSKHHGGELVAAILKAHDVKEIFTLCGGHISPILVAAHNLGIRIFDTRHEASAVFAADAVARLRQGVGVAVVTAGPGLTNTVTAVKNSQMAETAVVLIAGSAPTLLKDRGALQDIDQLTLMRSLCKCVARVTRVKNIVPVLREAICAAQSDTPGPVFVEIPIDVLYPYRVVLDEIGAFRNARNFRQFGGGDWFKQDLSPIPVTVPLPGDDDIHKLRNRLQEAKKPVLIMGSQAVLPPISVHELRKAVEVIRIPTYLGGMSRGLLGDRNPIQMRYNRKETLKEADLIILAGAVCDFRLAYGRAFSVSAKVVPINRNMSQLLKNEGMFWRADLAVQADVATTLVRLSQCLGQIDYREPQKWISYLMAKEEAKNAANMQKMGEKNAGSLINPLRALSLIDEVLPDDAILIADGGDFVGSAAYIVHPRGPLQWLDPGAFGTLGVGAGFALGAKAVHPNRPVVILYGDGSCGFSLLEFDTFVRHKLSVIALIGNDACWSQIAREQLTLFNSPVAVYLKSTRYDRVGAALGARDELIANEEDLSKKRFEEIFASACNGTSVVVNIVIGKSTFREGSISV